ncbi:MAG TPA: hypothetical protein VH414_11590 [Lichenihabitans sp.]|jgi:hypothetical protein|nr:hypothetical protein [Lichenihabitans sp.]
MSMTNPGAPGLQPGDAGSGRTVTAFFDTRAGAQTAVDDLVAAGIARERISMVEGGSEPVETDPVPTAQKGFWETLKDLFMPEEDRHSYGEGLRRGGFLLAVRDDGSQHDQILDILDREGTVNMDERESLWRTEGWDPARAGRDLMAEESLGRAPVLPPAGAASPVAPQAATGLGATVPTDDLRDAYRDAPAAPAVPEPDALPADEAAPGRVARRDGEGGRARVRSYLDDGL